MSYRIATIEMHANAAISMTWLKRPKLDVSSIRWVEREPSQSLGHPGQIIVVDVDTRAAAEAAI
jgi:hypothetical protein